MAAGKIFAISFAINAALGGGFSAAMSGGANAMRRIKEESGRVKMEQRQLDAAAADIHAQNVLIHSGSFVSGRSSRAPDRCCG